MDSINKRRSVRRFLNQPVEAEKIDKLLRAAMQAPSAGNQQPWAFIVVDDPNTLEQLSKMSPYAGPIKAAPLAIVVLSNLNGVAYPQYAFQDLGAATENLLLEAVSLELGSVWLGVSPEADRMSHVKSVLNLPDDINAFCVVAVGYPQDANANQFIDRYKSTCVFWNTFGNAQISSAK